MKLRSLFASRAAKRILAAALVLCLLSVAAFTVLSHWTYVPPEALATSRRFVDLAKRRQLSEAYSLTDQGRDVGLTLQDFDTRIRQQLGTDSLPLDAPVEMIGVRSGPQSYGNRLRRWLFGRTVDPDYISIDYFVSVPFEVRLRSHAGQWRVVFFQSHAM
jgi:hypothetical protein